MKLHCFSNLHPLVLVMYYFFLLIFIFYLCNPFFIIMSFFSVVILNYFCGCICQTISFIKYFFVFGLMLLVSNLILMQPINIIVVSNFISFCSSTILFLSFNKIIDSGKFLYLCSKISPHLALILNICVRYIFILQKRINDFVCIHSLNNNDKKKLNTALISKIFDWSINDCIELAEVLKAKNYTSNFTHYKIYKFNFRDIIFTCGIFFFGSAVFFCTKNFFALFVFLFFYLFLPFTYDFFCFTRFFIMRKVRND